MKLISEFYDQDIETLVESTMNGKKFYIEGRWADVDREVKNGRTYPRSVMESAIKKYSTDYIQQKRSMGELNHPAKGFSVNLERASHLIENLKVDSKNGECFVYGKAKIMESTPMGAIAKALIEEGVKLGVSTRGLGTLVERNGKKYVHNDFVLGAIDIVSDPSGHNCFVNGIQENVEYSMLDDGTIIQLAVDHAKKKINESNALKEFSRLMSILKS